MRKQRNNVSRMPWDHRRIVCRCLVDGATYAEVREALTAAGEPLVAHDRSLQAYQKCDEYRKYADLARGYREDLERERIEAATLNDGRGPESAADLIVMDVLRKLRDVTAGQDGASLDELASITKAVSPILRNQIAEAKLENDRRLEKAKAAHAAEIAGLQNEIAELREHLERARAAMTERSGGVDPEERARIMAAVDDYMAGPK